MAARAQVVVDVFDGGPKTRVEVNIGNLKGPSMTLARTSVPDPYIVDAYADAAFQKPSWLEPSPSSHIWVGALPEQILPGLHALTVRAIDEYGRAFVSQLDLTIV